MPLDRVDHVAHDPQGRPVRRVTRYVERRGGQDVPVEVTHAKAPPAAPRASPAPAADLAASGAPGAAPAADGPPAVDLEDTEAIRSLRAALGDVAARLATLERATAGAGVALQALDGLVDDVHAMRSLIAEGLAAVTRRVTSIEDVLAALEAAAAAVAAEHGGQ